MKCCGIDLSYTGTGVCVINDNKVLHRRLICTEPVDGIDVFRCLTIARSVVEVVQRYRPSKIALEGYAYGKQFGGEKLGELGGIVKEHLFTMGYPWETIPPPKLQKWVLGKAYRSAEGKERMIAAAREAGCETFDDNVADAFWCARWARDGAPAVP